MFSLSLPSPLTLLPRPSPLPRLWLRSPHLRGWLLSLRTYSLLVPFLPALSSLRLFLLSLHFASSYSLLISPLPSLSSLRLSLSSPHFPSSSFLSSPLLPLSSLRLFLFSLHFASSYSSFSPLSPTLSTFPSPSKSAFILPLSPHSASAYPPLPYSPRGNRLVFPVWVASHTPVSDARLFIYSSSFSLFREFPYFSISSCCDFPSVSSFSSISVELIDISSL